MLLLFYYVEILMTEERYKHIMLLAINLGKLSEELWGIHQSGVILQFFSQLQIAAPLVLTQ